MSEDGVEEIIAEPNEASWASSVVANINTGLEILQRNAWFIAATACLIYYFWINKFSAKYRQWIKKRKLHEDLAKLKKDPDIELEREEARMCAINKLQQQYNEMAHKAKEIEKENEKQKRQKSIEKLKLSEGRKLGGIKDYYPLSGQGARRYKVSSRRTSCQGGC